MPSLRRKHPLSPLDKVVGKFKHYLHYPDPLPLYVSLGAMAANMLTGEPMWLMLVGPPSCGKGRILEAFMGIDRVVGVDRVEGPGSFVSAVPAKERTKKSTGGVLMEIGKHGGIIMKDFTGVLSMDQKTITGVLDVFRQAYDGSYTRGAGSDGGVRLAWNGKMALLGGVTGEIDYHSAVNQRMGERFMYYRFDSRWETGGVRAAHQKAIAGLDFDARVEGWKEEIRDEVTKFYLRSDLSFGHQAKRRVLSEIEKLRLARLGEIVVICRSNCRRDPYDKTIVSPSETEEQSRAVQQLAQLLLGMEEIGVPTRDCWRGVVKVALDSMPLIKKLVVSHVMRVGGGGVAEMDMKQMTHWIGVGRTTLDRVVEELEMHGGMRKNKDDGKTVRVEATKLMRELWRDGVRA